MLPTLLRWELAALGYREVAKVKMPSTGDHLAMFWVAGSRPVPATIQACRTKADFSHQQDLD